MTSVIRLSLHIYYILYNNRSRTISIWLHVKKISMAFIKFNSCCHGPIIFCYVKYAGIFSFVVFISCLNNFCDRLKMPPIHCMT